MESRPSSSGSRHPSRIPLVIFAFGAMAATIDMNVAAVTLPALRKEFDLTAISAQWAISLGLVASAMSVPLSGWATRRWGVRTVWIVALSVFGAGAIFASLAPTFPALLIARVVQGAAGGIILPVGQTLVLRTTGNAAMGRTLGTMNVPLLVGPILGPVIGSALVATTGWRGVFVVGMPLLAVSIAITLLRLPKDENRITTPPPDIIGMALLSPGIALIIWASVSLRESASWPPLVLGLVGFGAIGTFVGRSWHRGRRAVLDLDLFRRRQFGTGAAIAFFFNIANVAGIALLVGWLTDALEVSVGLVGFFIAWHGAGSLVALLTAGRAADRYGSAPVIAVGAIGATLATLSLLFVGPGTSPLIVMVALAARGIGLSASMIATYAVAYRGLDIDSLPDATGAMNVVGRIGGALGVSFLFILLGNGSADAFAAPLIALVVCSGLIVVLSLLAHDRGIELKSRNPQ